MQKKKIYQPFSISSQIRRVPTWTGCVIYPHPKKQNCSLEEKWYNLDIIKYKLTCNEVNMVSADHIVFV